MKLICIGDSLTYGLGVPVEESWVELLNRESPWDVKNVGINGDTTGGMLARFSKDVLDARPDRVLIMGGANDFIMGCDVCVVKANIMAMVHQARAARLGVIVCTQPSGDAAHVRSDWQGLSDFDMVARKLFMMARWLEDFCRAFQIPLIPLHDRFAEGIFGNVPGYFIDGVHPNRKGHRLIADIILQSEAWKEAGR